MRFLSGTVLAASFILCAFSAQAQDQARNMVPPVSPDACRNLMVEYQSGVDGSADYKPGVDITGKPVVEADVYTSGIPAPKVVTFDLTVDMAQFLSLPVSPVPEGKISVATITILPDGRVLRDGEPLEGAPVDILRSLCKIETQPVEPPIQPLEK